jgi:hypothetical protein
MREIKFTIIQRTDEGEYLVKEHDIRERTFRLSVVDESFSSLTPHARPTLARRVPVYENADWEMWVDQPVRPASLWHLAGVAYGG